MSTFKDLRGTEWQIDLSAVSRDRITKNLWMQTRGNPDRIAERLGEPRVCANVIAILAKGTGNVMRLRSNLLDSPEVRAVATLALVAALKPAATPQFKAAYENIQGQ